MSILVYVGVGSNRGDRRAAVRAAVDRIASEPGVTVARCSSLYETEPWGRADQPWFVNAVVEIRTTLEPPRLLRRLQAIERALGRRREEEGDRWGPRALDLDILLYGACVLHEPDLTLPHPRLHERRFVLEPLCELNPRIEHPLLGKTAEELLAIVDDPAAVRLIER